MPPSLSPLCLYVVVIVAAVCLAVNNKTNTAAVTYCDAFTASRITTTTRTTSCRHQLLHLHGRGGGGGGGGGSTDETVTLGSDGMDDNDDDDITDRSSSSLAALSAAFLQTRRQSTTSAAAVAAAAVTTAFGWETAAPSASSFVANAAATTEGGGTTATTMTKQEILQRLVGIPTFTLVNEEGVPLIIYDKYKAIGTGYFFFSKAIALQALAAATASVDPADGTNLFEKAHIKVVPLSVAIQLALTNNLSVATNPEEKINGIKVKTIHLIIPTEDGNTDAVRLDTSRGGNAKKWETKGRVPLFSVTDPATQRKYYSFDTAQAITQYKQRNPQDLSLIQLPSIEIEEFVLLMDRAVTVQKNWSSLRDLATSLQPTAEMRTEAIDLLTQEQKAGNVRPYDFTQAYLVGAA